MLRPERMSRVSVTGSKRVMDDVIETVHDLRLLHVTDYEGAWEGFDPGDPMVGADAASEKLVTVRSLQSILGVEDEDAGPARIVTEDALATELEEIRTEVNSLDDRRSTLRDDLRAVEDRIATMEPFARLGIDLDLLRGYDTLSVAVGEGDEQRVRRALVDADVDSYEVYEGDGVLAVFARTDDLDSILVDAEFTAYEIPDADGSPEEYLEDLRHEREQLRSKLRTVEDELDEQRLDVGGFLLAAEETLAIKVQQREAPLSFATTENAFVAEGWIPTTRFVDLAEGLYEEVGDHVEVDELERAQYDGEGKVISREEVGGRDAPGTPDPTAADGGQVRADGGADVSAERGVHGQTNTNPPVIQKNPSGVRAYETLVQVINRPKYSEIDPTIFVFLTFPIFFGLMIGDLGYGLLYMTLGWFLATRFDNPAIKSLGGVGIFAGVFTAIFGILYGEIFGLHVLGEVVWPSGSPPFHKGLQPHYEQYALLWLVVSVLFGILHLAIGWIVDFYQRLDHGFGEAMLESGSWLVMMFGLWAWIFSYALEGTSPGFMVGPDSVFNGNPVALGFTGLPAFDLFTIPVVGMALSGWLVVFLVGLVMLVAGEPIEAVEFLNVLVNVLSYTRLAAVLLAKAGMAFVVNLLVFGAYEHHGEWHFIFTEGYTVSEVTSKYGAEAVMFPGLVNGEGAVAVVLGAIGGILLLVVGHALVLVLGITSAGLQAVRLEYVEFFGKFFEGGGETYSPFGYDRRYTTED
ncbi:V-type ATP synthase subunit I [Halomarina rubra]|uniref:A-type ATP synthase subunit I n=1 Tax=Halomarina rubra TaxID=2071873 RepID=A0ABD6AU14_9EURY|nr:V-type ATP synthase subunit I [Halomarina rubra]